jgi:hypothetical protein
MGAPVQERALDGGTAGAGGIRRYREGVGQVLTEVQRPAWNAAASKVRSRPRLWQSGWLTGQTFFQGICSARSRIGGDAAVAARAGGVRAAPGRRAEHWRRAGADAASRAIGGAGGRGHHGLWSGAMQRGAEEVAKRGLPRDASGASERGERHHGTLCGEVWGTQGRGAGVYPDPAAERWVGGRGQGYQWRGSERAADTAVKWVEGVK